ncbi:major facilitator superfamily domain-containing protein [Aspergillus lucknowensis]|uniref:Major facilitator superfamily domain-containing protein n=1 Tax=Aspergillus lucknowensis TaxID=176173 RepID=A0ABR4LIK3_9EURO
MSERETRSQQCQNWGQRLLPDRRRGRLSPADALSPCSDSLTHGFLDSRIPLTLPYSLSNSCGPVGPSNRQIGKMTVSEESPLLPSPDAEEGEISTKRAKRSDILIIYAGFLGVLIASADESVMISTYSAIASQFHRLSEGSWLLLAYNFGYCISLPVYSVICDVYGRKNVLLASYSLFALSCLACGASTSITFLVLSRVLTGSSSAGIIVVVSIILTDFLPTGDVALYRGYQNVVNVTGRSFGAPIGGFLADTVGWRWSFYGQIPIILLCAVFSAYRLPSSLNNTSDEDPEPEIPARRSPFRDLDFGGIFTFSATVLALLFLLQALGGQNETMSLQIPVLTACFVSGCVLFIMIELFWARKPLIPIRLLTWSLTGYFFLQVVLLGGRFALVTNLVPFLIRTEDMSDFLASLSYVCVAVGVSIGGVFSGLVIKYTKRSKSMTLTTTLLLLILYVVVLFQWRHGFALWQCVYLFAIGFLPGILFPALFVGVSSSAPEGTLSACIGTYYLSQQLGLIIGPACGFALSQGLFEKNLWRSLGDVTDKKTLINRILNEVRYASTLPPSVQKVVRESYLASFQSLPLLAMGAAALMLPILAVLKEPKIA